MKWTSLFVTGLLAFALLPASATVRVIATTTDLEAITREIGGNRVQVESLSRATEDLHKVEPRPSFVTKLARADMVVRVGMDLDLWLESLVQSARNAKIRQGAPGYVDCSAGITALDVPAGKVDGAKGDIHVYGNPHYWLDPENGKIIARNILAGLRRVDPPGAATYQRNYDAFVKKIDEHMVKWRKQMEPMKGTKVVTYHTTWSYFARQFGLNVVGTLEPKPGIPPSAAHVNGLIRTMKRDNVRLGLIENCFPTRFVDLVGRESGATMVTLPTSVGGAAAAKDYCALFDVIIGAVTGAR